MPACLPLRLLLGDLMVSSSNVFLQTLDIVPEIVSLPIFFFAFSFNIRHENSTNCKRESKYSWGYFTMCGRVCLCCVYLVAPVSSTSKHLLHPTSSPHCHCCLLCPSHQRLLPVLLQKFPSCIHLFFFLIYLFIYLFIYFWLRWVFVAVRRLSLIAVRGLLIAVASLVVEHGL